MRRLTSCLKKKKNPEIHGKVEKKHTLLPPETPLTPPTPPYLHHHTHTTLHPLNQFDQRDPPALTSPPAGNLPACRCERSPFSRPPSERISLSLPLRLWRYDQRGRNPTDNSRTLLIPSPPWLLLLCNICLSLGGFGEGGVGGMQIVWNTFQNIND